MSNISLSSIPPSVFWYLDEKAKRQWHSLSFEEQAHEIEKAKHEELAWKENPVKEWWGEKNGPLDQLVTPIAAMQWWMKKLFGEVLSSDDLTAYCCAEHGMTITRAQSMPIPEIVNMLKDAYEKKVGLERPATEKPEAGPAEVSGAAGTTGRISKLALALAVLKDHPDWTLERIASLAGCHEKYLSRSKKFRDARKVIRAIGKEENRHEKKHLGHDMDTYSDEASER
jgi:hypothetical protein